MQSSRKQPSRRLEKPENSRRWLLIPALCAAVILAVVLVAEFCSSVKLLSIQAHIASVVLAAVGGAGSLVEMVAKLAAQVGFE